MPVATQSPLGIRLPPLPPPAFTRNPNSCLSHSGDHSYEEGALRLHLLWAAPRSKPFLPGNSFTPVLTPDSPVLEEYTEAQRGARNWPRPWRTACRAGLPNQASASQTPLTPSPTPLTTHVLQKLSSVISGAPDMPILFPVLLPLEVLLPAQVPPPPGSLPRPPRWSPPARTLSKLCVGSCPPLTVTLPGHPELHSPSAEHTTGVSKCVAGEML